MSMRMHEVTLIYAERRHTRLAIADSSIKALRIALDKLPDDIDGPCALICKPLLRLSELSTEAEATPCAA